MLKGLVASLLLAAGVFAGSDAALAAPMVLSGSTTVQKRVLEPTADAIEKATGIVVEIRGIGSGSGFKELMAGKVPASVASSSLNTLLEKYDVPDDGTYREHVITKDVIVPLVHQSNPIRELSWQQLSDIHTGRVANWRELGGPDCDIQVITSHTGSATPKVFQKQVMDGQAYTENSKAVKSDRQLVGRVARSTCGIGAVSESLVAQDSNKNKVRVIRTDPIERPLVIITKGAPNDEVSKLITFLLTSDAQRHFR